MNFRPLASTPVSLLAVSLSALLLAAPARAEVVLDTFGPGDTAPGLNWSLFTSQSLAVPFSLSSDSTIDDILTSISGAGTYQLGIVAGPGLPSGDFLYSTTLTDPIANSQASGLGWALNAGDYWLVSKTESDTGGTWKGGSQPGTQSWAFTGLAGNQVTWFLTGPSDAPAARITVSAIPEPGTWALMFGGLVMIGALAKRRAG